ncbi:MAG: hypothetical protein PHU23_17760, partial [Dehalococcoidales bacterium]|nr:hypothetical protein [Dehalococcoidales bacterium]
RDVKTTEQGRMSIYKHIPDMASLVYAGKVWAVQDQTTTAGLTAPPTTTAGLTMQNPESSGRVYIVLGVSFIGDVTPAAIEQVTIWHCAHKLAAAALTRDITLQATGAGAIMGMAALQGAYDGVVILDRGATVIDDGWVPISTIDFHIGVSLVDFGLLTKLIVPVVVPPGGSYSVAPLVTEATQEIGLGFVWAEVEEAELS